MKPVKLNINAKLPVPPAVDVTKFESKPEKVGAPFREDLPGEAPLPPPPAQMNMPVGPPPPPVEMPQDYEGYIETAKKASKGRLDFAQLWATLAQAAATKLMADRLEELLEFLGANDNDLEPDDDDDDEPVGSRLEDQIAAGLLNAFGVIKEDEMGEVTLADVMAGMKDNNGTFKSED